MDSVCKFWVAMAATGGAVSTSVINWLHAGSLIVAIIGGLLAIAGGYYAFRIKRREYLALDRRYEKEKKG